LKPPESCSHTFLDRERAKGGTRQRFRHLACFYTIALLERRSDRLIRHIDAVLEAAQRTRREQASIRLQAQRVREPVTTLPASADSATAAVAIRRASDSFGAGPADHVSRRTAEV
jgi:hypothetical protein